MTGDTITPEVFDLVGQIVQANVDSLAQTNSRIIEYKDEQIRTLAQTVLDLWDIIDLATVVDRKTEGRLSLFAHRVDEAERIRDWLADAS